MPDEHPAMFAGSAARAEVLGRLALRSRLLAIGDPAATALPGRDAPRRTTGGPAARGFTLVEVMVAMVLLSIGMTALIAAFVSSGQIGVLGRRQNAATTTRDRSPGACSSPRIPIRARQRQPGERRDHRRPELAVRTGGGAFRSQFTRRDDRHLLDGRRELLRLRQRQYGAGAGPCPRAWIVGHSAPSLQAQIQPRIRPTAGAPSL